MFVNLTPHTINIVTDTANVSIAPSGAVARCAATTAPVAVVEGVSLARTTYGEVEGLPPPSAGTIYIVSALVRLAVTSREDVASPGDLVRDADGKPVGCRGLVVN